MEYLENFLLDDESLYKIAQFIFDIASANKFYSELYADLYLEFIIYIIFQIKNKD
jgi:hypothetical protein